MLSGPLQSESFTDTPAARGQVIIIIIDVVVSSRSASSRRRSRRTRTPTRRRLRPRFRRRSSSIGTLEIHMSAILAVRSVATKLKTLNLTPIAAVASGRAMGRANRNPGLRKQSRTKADEPALGRLSGLLIHNHP
jgi:hypothetical protein